MWVLEKRIVVLGDTVEPSLCHGPNIKPVSVCLLLHAWVKIESSLTY